MEAADNPRSAVCEKALCLLVRKDVLARGRLGEVACRRLKSSLFLHFFSTHVSVVKVFHCLFVLLCS